MKNGKGGLAYIYRGERHSVALPYGFFKKEIIKERTGDERGGNKEESLRDTRPPRLSESQMEEVDGAYRDIPTLFIELRNPKIKSCHCNHAGKNLAERTIQRKREKEKEILEFGAC